MSAREDILTLLRRRERDVTPPPPWTSRRRFESLSDQFAEALTANLGEVRRAPGWQEALAEVDAILEELSPERVVVNDEPPVDRLPLGERWPSVSWRRAGESGTDKRESLRTFCAAADLGISGANGALAETGSVIISSGAGKSRLVTLLPPVHLVLLPASRLSVDIFTWTAARGTQMPANVVLVSGPSKTADIEQTMAVGVHGPKRLIVVLIEAL